MLFAVAGVAWRVAATSKRRGVTFTMSWPSLAAGALTAAAWLAPVGIAFALGGLTFTYGTLGFDQEFKHAVPVAALLLTIGFVFGVEPAVRCSGWTAAGRLRVGIVISAALMLTRRAGPAEASHWAFAVWEFGWLWCTAQAIGWRWPGGPGAALPLAVVSVVRLYALSRFDGPFETLGHMVAPAGFHVLAQLVWPALLGAGWLLAVRQRSGRIRT